MADDVQAAVDEIGEQRRRNGRVLRRSLHSPSGTFTPSVLIARLTTFVRPFRSMPSSISTANRMSSMRRAISSPNRSLVRATNVLETADLLIDRDACSTSLPTGSCVRA